MQLLASSTSRESDQIMLTPIMRRWRVKEKQEGVEQRSIWSGSVYTLPFGSKKYVDPGTSLLYVRNSCCLLTWRRRCQKKLLPLRNPICPGFCHIVHHYFFETHCSTNSFVRSLFLFSCAVDPSNKKICIKQNPANKTWLHHISSSSSTSTHSVTFQVRRLLRRLSPPVEPAVLWCRSLWLWWI